MITFAITKVLVMSCTVKSQNVLIEGAGSQSNEELMNLWYAFASLLP